ncbi:MAG: tetratricopeptide repeat protein [Anaerolineae bacterium]|nr:tetratricopeptide repeat protein [Anaerolineae bacterium]
MPADLLQLGEAALFVGDIDGATLALQAALAISSDAQLGAQALLALGQTYLLDQAYDQAADAFQELDERYPDSEQAHAAHFLHAEALMETGNAAGAAWQYQLYLKGGTAIGPYVHEWLGDALQAAGELDSALNAYRVAVDSAPDLSLEVGVREKIGLLHAAEGDFAAALEQYDAILAQARIADYRARIGHLAAETAILAGQVEAGYARHLEIVLEYPASPWAYQSLVVLVGAGVPVDDLTRGIVDYHAGAYSPAVAALYRYIESSESHSGDAHYYAGLAHLEAGSPALAAYQFRTLVETHPESPFWGEAWLHWGKSLEEQGDIGGAVQVYANFAQTAPSHPLAAESLWSAAQALERSQDHDAAAAYESCQAAYPASDYAAQALFRAGLYHYRRGETARAVSDWQALVEQYPSSEHSSAAYLWLGKARLAAGDTISATAAFSQAARIDPLGYYGLRAADMLQDPFAPPFRPASYAPPADLAAEQAAAEAWLASWLGLASGSRVGELDATLQDDPRLQRGLELWRLGQWEAARNELENLRRATADDPLAQYRLALLYRDIGLYRSSIIAASNLIALSPAASTLDAPPFLARLAYPTHYAELVLSNAMEQDLPPLLVFALIRQESLFEGFATSWAYAHGLMQVIPSTGAYIAGQLGWPPDYETDDLYRPYVSIRFGTWYLAEQQDRFAGQLHATLAGYNGGPTNAARWLEAAGGDPDLFLETIGFRETQLYLKLIREHYAIYTALYGAPLE